MLQQLLLVCNLQIIWI